MTPPDFTHVLHVEDSPTDSLLTREELASHPQIRLTQVDRLERALEALGSGAFAVVLLDLGLPDSQGLDTLRRIRRENPHVPVVVMTANASDALGMMALREGAQDFLIKGEGRENLLARTIRYAIERHAMAQRLLRSEERHRLLFAANPEPMWLYDLETLRFVEVNEAAVRQYGYTRDEFLAMTIRDIRPEEDIPKLDAEIFVRSAPPQVSHWRHRKKDGTLIDVEISSTDFSDGDRPARFVLALDITYRKRAEKSLRASEERFRSFMDNSPAAAFVKDGAGRYLYVNPTWLKQFDPPPADWLGKTDFDLWPRETAELFRASDRDCLEGDGPVQREEVGRSVAGGEVAWLVMKFPLVEGGRRGIGGMAWDISEHKRAENKFRLFRALLDHSVDGIEVIDPANGRYLDVSEGACLAHGYTREEYLALGVPDLDPFFAETGWEEQRRRGRFDGPRSFETLHRRKDGSTFPVEVNFNTIRLDREYMVAVVRDITDRRKTQNALLLRDRAIRAATQGIVITDAGLPDNPIVFASPGFERITGYSYREVLGRNCRFMQGKDTDAATVARLREAVRAGEACTLEILNYRKDGRPFWNELSISPVRDAGGALTHFVGVQQDVTPRRGLEDQFRQAQKMEAFGQLAGGVAHDFNNLLTVITCYSEMLLELMGPRGANLDMVQEIHGAAARAAQLTRQLLAFSRRQVIQPQVVDLGDIVAGLRKMLGRLIGEDVKLSAVTAAGLDRVRVDPGQIDQVIVNLVVNARDAMPNGGKITLETANVTLDRDYGRSHAEVEPGRYVLLAVSDTGSGMTEDVKRQIFEPFFTTKDVGKGTGLGLATVFGIVKQSGGHIGVYSEFGRGTTFKIYLPSVEGSEAPDRAEAGPPPIPPGTETLLLVEDEASVRGMTKRALVSHGYTVLDAGDGAEAIRLCAGYPGPIHLLISDVVMPQVGGRQLAERLAELHPETRVLFMSGYTDDAVVRHGVLQAEVAFLQKPFSMDALQRKVREVLDAGRIPPHSKREGSRPR